MSLRQQIRNLETDIDRLTHERDYWREQHDIVGKYVDLRRDQILRLEEEKKALIATCADWCERHLHGDTGREAAAALRAMNA